MKLCTETRASIEIAVYHFAEKWWIKVLSIKIIFRRWIVEESVWNANVLWTGTKQNLRKLQIYDKCLHHISS
jgi:hypothetical protein